MRAMPGLLASCTSLSPLCLPQKLISIVQRWSKPYDRYKQDYWRNRWLNRQGDMASHTHIWLERCYWSQSQGTKRKYFCTIYRLLILYMQGPVMAYMKKVTDAAKDPGYGAGWFKIQEAGLATCKSSRLHVQSVINVYYSRKVGNRDSSKIPSAAKHKGLFILISSSDRKCWWTINHHPGLHCSWTIPSQSRANCTSWRSFNPT
jgi:hypothetical protein